jgi:hypothetical protein
VIGEYFSDLDATPVPPESHESEMDARYTVHSKLSTGLFYGILTDTNRLTAGCSAAGSGGTTVDAKARTDV